MGYSFLLFKILLYHLSYVSLSLVRPRWPFLISLLTILNLLLFHCDLLSTHLFRVVSRKTVSLQFGRLLYPGKIRLTIIKFSSMKSFLTTIKEFFLLWVVPSNISDYPSLDRPVDPPKHQNFVCRSYTVSQTVLSRSGV